MINHLGIEFLDSPTLSASHRLYIRVFGIPISGLRIRLRRILPEIKGNFKSIADLGCGKGIFTFELARRFPRAQVIGIDTDEELVRTNNLIAQKRGIKNVRFQVRDILDLKSESEFDLILSVDNLEHIEDDRTALKKIYQALTPDGVLVCHVPALERIWLFRKVQTNFDVPGHVRPGYRLTEIREKLKAEKFEIDEIKPTYGYLETVSNNISYLITGASQRNKGLYAVAFPFLNLMAWLGRNQDPKDKGAGVLAIAKKWQATSAT